MSIQLPQGFNIRSAESIDKRITLTKSEMLSMNDNIMPDKYLCICKDDGKIYTYDKASTPTTETGKFSPAEVESISDAKIREICV